MSTSSIKLMLTPEGNPDKMRKADTLDREYLAQCVKEGTDAIINDEILESNIVLLTVTRKAWKEMGRLG